MKGELDRLIMHEMSSKKLFFRLAYSSENDVQYCTFTQYERAKCFITDAVQNHVDTE
jgi:hypothetical protein